MADVARLAGVSQQTVSRVLNESPHVSPTTRERVQDAVRKLAYRPNRVARALVTGPLAHARRRLLRHHAVRAGVDAARDRARRPRRRLLRQHRQPALAGPDLDARTPSSAWASRASTGSS